MLLALYKLMAKVMANQMQKGLSSWIRASQTGFVRNRNILDNVFLAYKAMEWAQESNQDLVILMIDFEKAYDRANWNFLREAMRELDFHEEWIAQTAALYEGARSSVLVNGKQTQEYELERGVRRGCPMVPYIFFFVQEVFGYMLCDPDFEIEGSTIPDSSTLRESFFVDDSAIFLKGSRENMKKVFHVLDLFSASSGAKMNLGKSRAIWCFISLRDSTFDKTEALSG